MLNVMIELIEKNIMFVVVVTVMILTGITICKVLKRLLNVMVFNQY